jgi:hypothetical protein
MVSMYHDSSKQEIDRRSLWERPVVRRLVTKDAEGDGILQDEGANCSVTNQNAHSCKGP